MYVIELFERVKLDLTALDAFGTSFKFMTMYILSIQMCTSRKHTLSHLMSLSTVPLLRVIYPYIQDFKSLKYKLRSGRQGFDFRQGRGLFFHHCFHTFLSGVPRVSGLKRLGCEAHHSPQFSAEVKKV